MQGSILIVEDDPALLESLHGTLTALGLNTEMAATGEYALRLLATHPIEVVLLDLNMPGVGGMATCRVMREAHPDLAIIVLTVRDHIDDKVNALDAGADDYVTKPFHLPELIARVRAALRRKAVRRSAEQSLLAIGEIRLDLEGHQVRRGGEIVHLTPTEFSLLHVLMKNAGRPIAHRSLLTSVWGSEYGDEREYLRTYMNQLRRKLEEDPAHPKYLLTENYIGYRFARPDA
ncbi:two-component system, OmpR family, KDP operon response regulator KdpE [Bryocella elongata]|uniref:Two-component system, OmpR family, KDP operon response regulator KdpE n=1 Tax=Bryocella elongata TaxID=863522 RepID=A0A1H5WMK7_9BACT|nr:response regulator transcription factor [Bryocella elongata]SEG00712.1 two-component system, OmpR family, KDP operon response regulator KdpE [Bryocella elongata]